MTADRIRCPSCGVPSGPCLDVAGRIVPTHASRLRELERTTRPPKSERRRIRTGAVKRYKPRRYDSRDAQLERHARHARERRERLSADGWCINGELHGKATDGVLCAACRQRHRAGRDNRINAEQQQRT